MFRILEAVGVLAPLGGIVVMVVYRRRAKAGLAWGVAGALVALVASVLGFLSPHLSLLGDGASSGEALLGNMRSWAVLRVALLVLSVILLVIGTCAGRRGERVPVGGLVTGIPLVALGLVSSFIHVDLGANDEGLSEILDLLLEAAQFALLGLGVLVLSLAVVSGRSSDDGRREPAAAVVGAALRAKRLYDRAHARRR